LLDKKLNEPYWLEKIPIAEMVAGSLHFLSKKIIELWCFCIMPNHVHALFFLKNDEKDMFRVMQQHKSFTAGEANRILNFSGQFWEMETYDHVVRTGEFDNIVSYILNNLLRLDL
jgi:putative transposase